MLAVWRLMIVALEQEEAHDGRTGRDRRHRGRSGRAGAELLPDPPRSRPRRPRTRAGGRTLAQRALGFPGPDYAQLDDPAAGLRLPGRRPGWLPRPGRGGPVLRRLRGLLRAAAAVRC